MGTLLASMNLLIRNDLLLAMFDKILVDKLMSLLGVVIAALLTWKILLGSR